MNKMNKVYDVLILGAGPAGLTAGLYAARARLSTLIVEWGADGGQMALTGTVENYPGVAEQETGPALAKRMAEQAEQFGAERVQDTIERVSLNGETKTLTGQRGIYRGRTVILAAGASPRPIGCKNEDAFRGRGISYCATCDGAFFRGLDVYVAGGGDAAVEEADFLTRYARKVTVIHRRNKLRAARYLQERAFANPKIDFLWDSVVEAVDGSDMLSHITVRNVQTGAQTEIEADPADGVLGLFGFVGYTPHTQIFAGILDLDRGYIVTDADMHTTLPGVFAAGDIRVKSLRQIVTAAADGAIAAVQAEKYLS